MFRVSRMASTEVAFGTEDRVEFHLDNWAGWMRSGQEVDRLPNKSSGLSSGGSSKAFDDMAEASDRRVAHLVNTIIDDMMAAHQSAIYHHYLHAVFRYPRGNKETLLAEAKLLVGKGLAAKGVW